MPNIPNVSPEIDLSREDVINLLLASIAFEELGLAHLVNAEAEKVQFVLGTLEGQIDPQAPSIGDLLEINQSVERTLRAVIKKEMLLQFKLEDILRITPVGPLPPPPVPPPPVPQCSEPNARTRGFWGTGEGGIRRLIDEGTVDFESFVDNVLIPIVGPGGRSPFLNQFFDPELFAPNLDRQGIFDRYVALFTQSVEGSLLQQLIAQIFTAYLNVVATNEGILPPNEVCVDGNTMYANQKVEITDLENCEFNVLSEPQLIAEVFETIEEILGNCCADVELECEDLSNEQVSDLIDVLDRINNNQIFIASSESE